MGTDTKSKKRDESSVIDAATVLELGGDILRSPVFAREDEARHHGDTTTLEHTLLVALLAFRLARRKILSPRVDLRLLVRACLLHDLYLYDWHNPDTHGGLHGFHHPRVAASNRGVGREGYISNRDAHVPADRSGRAEALDIVDPVPRRQGGRDRRLPREERERGT